MKVKLKTLERIKAETNTTDDSILKIKFPVGNTECWITPFMVDIGWFGSEIEVNNYPEYTGHFIHGSFIIHSSWIEENIVEKAFEGLFEELRL